ncbi:MAG: hypothetical protein EBR60_09515 [Burkholderiaceae bacterium]|nr:hypothetical protein [Burkholderiaceae bacterium]
MNGLQFECIKIALKQDNAGFVLTVRIHPDDIPEELFRDFVGARYACVLVRIGEDERPVTYVNRVQQAGILCKNLNFQGWLYEHYGIEDTTEQAASKFVCDTCGIQSRSELATNLEAQLKFDKVIEQYERTKAAF